jgi:hypothetical protein
MLIRYIPTVTYYRLVPYYYKCYRKQRENITLVTLHDKGKTVTVDLDLDTTDKGIISLITKGYSSAYSMWVTMKEYAKKEDIVILMEEEALEEEEKEKKKYVMTYKNINKRVIKLSRRGLIKEIKPSPYTVNLHGRKDYKLTMKGVLCLQDDIIAHPENIKDIIRYMKENQMDIREFTKLLNDRLTSTVTSTNLYRKYIGMDPFQLEWDKEGQITKFTDGTPPLKKKRKR